MLAKLLELMTGKDDLERVARRGDIGQLNAYLKVRRVWIPQRPRRFLDADSFTQGELLAQIQSDAEELGGDEFEPWILEVDDKQRLPVFSNQKKMVAFPAGFRSNSTRSSLSDVSKSFWKRSRSEWISTMWI